MAQNYFYPPSGGGSSNASVGINGVTAPTSATEVAGINPSGNLQPLQTDSSGALIITPAAGSTADENLVSVSGTPITLGQKTSAASLPVVIASDQSTLPISAASLPLPTGASTSANQTTANTTLSSIASNQTNGTQTTQVSNFPATQPVSGTVTVVQPTGTNLHTVVDSSALPIGASTSANQTTANTTLSAIQANQTNGTQHTIVDSSALPTGAATSANQTNASQKTQIVDGSGNVIASTSNALNVQVENFPATQPVSGTVTVTQATGTNLHTVVDSGTITVTQAIGTNLHAVIDSGTITLSGTSPVSGTVTANQGTPNATPWNENIAQINGATVQVGHGTAAGSLRVELPTDGTGVVGLNAGSNNIGSITNITGTVSLPTGAATSANQTSVIGSSTGGTAATNSELIGGTYNSTLPTLTTGQQSAFQLDTKGRQQVIQSTPVALTITNAAITVGTTAVRLTVSGSAPAATRVVLVATPDTASTATFYIGTSTVTNSGATRGIEIASGQSFIANNDAGDYWIVSSTASQTVTVMEQA